MIAAVLLTLATLPAALAIDEDTGPTTVREALLMAQARRDSPICYQPVTGAAGEPLVQIVKRDQDPPLLLLAGLGPTLESALSRLPDYADLDPLTVPPCDVDEPDDPDEPDETGEPDEEA